jgi:diaminopimelate epimerase
VSTQISVIKGHGTENTFVVIPDPEGDLDDVVTDDLVRRLTDRNVGLGADGVIRVAPTSSVQEYSDSADSAEWFMDYRNADGSLAEMCGNGIRVMARYLWESGMADAPVIEIATRGGIRPVHAHADGMIEVEMGRAHPARTRQMAFVAAHGSTWPAVPVSMPNPHAVVFVDDLDEPGRLIEPPELRPQSVFPESANVEFVVPRGDKHIEMRVWERGVGETRSCGTGVCAAAWAAMRRDGAGPGSTYKVDVPGGRLTVTERVDGGIVLVGPAELGLRATVEL